MFWTNTISDLCNNLNLKQRRMAHVYSQTHQKGEKNYDKREER